MRSWIVRCHQFNVYSTSVRDCHFPVYSKLLTSIAAVVKMRVSSHLFVLFISYTIFCPRVAFWRQTISQKCSASLFSELKVSLKKTQTKTWRWLLINRNVGIFWVICCFSVEIYNWFLLFQGFFLFFFLSIVYWKIAYSIICDTAFQGSYFLLAF